MSDNLHFLIADGADIPQLVSLVNSAYRGDSSKKGWTTEADLLDGIRTDEEALGKMIRQPDSVILKFTNNHNDLVGCVNLQKQGDKMYLGMLTVSPYIQAQGIGKEIVKIAEEYATQQGCSSVVMTVITVRHELIKWYERRGYHQTQEKRPFPKDPRFGIPKQPLEFVVMEKQL
jgi:N-acetylglutamate synthase-like GNAT family acetyltransferase